MAKGQKRYSVQQIRATFKRQRANAKPNVALVSQIRKVIRGDQETKYLDTTIGGEISGTGNVILLNEISEGTEDNERVGRHLRVKYIQCAFSMACGTSSQEMWTALVCDHQPNGADPTFAQMFTGTPGYEFKNVQDNGQRFKVCWIERCALSNSGPSIQSYDKFYAVPVDRPDGAVEYGSTDTPNTNAYYLVSNNSSLDVDLPAVFSGTARFAYTDA